MDDEQKRNGMDSGAGSADDGRAAGLGAGQIQADGRRRSGMHPENAGRRPLPGGMGVPVRDNYVRQGRINLDGYMLYQSSQGNTTVLDHMFRASQAFDSTRPTPVVANGKA